MIEIYYYSELSSISQHEVGHDWLSSTTQLFQFGWFGLVIPLQDSSCQIALYNLVQSSGMFSLYCQPVDPFPVKIFD